MYILTPQELKQIHDERIGHFQKMHTVSYQQKRNRKSNKWSIKNIFKRSNA